MFKSDTEVVTAIKSEGQRDAALVWVYRECNAMICKLGRDYGFADDDSKEVLHEAVVVFWERVMDGRLTLAGKISTFIYQICRNKFLNKVRDSRQHQFVELGDAYDWEDEVTDDEAKVLRELKLTNFLAELGERCRSLIMGFYACGCSMRELATKFNYSNEETATSQKYKCVMQLKKKFQTA